MCAALTTIVYGSTTDGYQQHQLLAKVVACYGYTAIGAGNIP